MKNDALIRLSYGFLWLYTGTDRRAHQARRLLLEIMEPEERATAIDEAKKIMPQPLDWNLPLRDPDGAVAGAGRLGEQ